MIEKMVKVTLAAVRSDAEKMAKELIWLRGVEVTPFPESEHELAADSVAGEITETEKRLDQAQSAIRVLSECKSAPKVKRKTLSRSRFEKLSEKEEAWRELTDRVAALEKRKAENSGLVTKTENEILALKPWLDLDVPLGTGGTAKTSLFLGMMPPGTTNEKLDEWAAQNSLEFVYEIVSSAPEGVYVCVICPKDGRNATLSQLQSIGFSNIRLPDHKGRTAREATEALEEKIKTLKDETDDVVMEEEKLAKRQDELWLYHDFLLSRRELLDVREKLAQTENVCLLEGWIPKRLTGLLEKRLEDVECYYEYREPTAEDDVPVSLRNNRFATPFESIIALYSYPAYNGFDPTFIMSIFYFIIFGMIMQDVAYGVILSVGAILLNRFMKPRGGAKKLIDAMGICGISTIVFGVLFGGYFGNLPAAIAQNMFGIKDFNIKAVLDPVANPMPYLYIAFALGAVHLITGMLISAYMMIKRGHPLDALFDVGSWLVFFAGIALIFLAPKVGKYVCLAGVAMLVLTQGRKQKNIFMKLIMGVYSLYNTISYASDLLSYSRILALGLSGAIIGQVVNIIGTITGNHSLLSFIVLILAILVGHTLNFALSVLGAFVHTARLQYIEFFNKFYEDGGKVFAPAEVRTKYIDIIEEETK